MDLETRSPVPIKHGTHAYAEQAEVLLWAYADDEGAPRVWDVINGTDNYFDELSDTWIEVPIEWQGSWTSKFQGCPELLAAMLNCEEVLVWFQNGGMFDFVILDKQEPWFTKLVPMARRRDTMVQAFAHSLPGALDKLGRILRLEENDRKLGDGQRLIRLFCIPKPDGTYNSKATHPADWQKFIEYAARDIITMRSAHRLMPMWNYRDTQVALWHADLVVQSRGFQVDVELAERAIEAAEFYRESLGKRTRVLTDGAVGSATQRDALLEHILLIWGVDLPDMQADTLERRMEDPDLPPVVKELLGIRLQASMNSPSKYRALLNGVSSDRRLRGTAQFRGAGRTGRWAHRLFQPGNLPRPAFPWPLIEACVPLLKAKESLDLVIDNPMTMYASMIRSVIVAPEGKKLIVTDLSNIEGRMAAWLAGEEWKLEAFRAFDRGEGHDLYVVSYCTAFGVSLQGIPCDQGKTFIGSGNRQIGKVQELMFQYGGGVGAWLTGAATYSIDLEAMTEAVYDTLPEDALDEARGFLQWIYEQEIEKREKALEKLHREVPAQITPEDYDAQISIIHAKYEQAKVKARFGLSERVFTVCDAIKRLWRRAHPRISSYWKEIEEVVKQAIEEPNVTFVCRRVKIRRDGTWLRVRLPSGRFLCYPNIHLTKKGEIAYTGQNTYTRQWGEVKTYGGKLFENWVQAAACDQFAECLPLLEQEGYHVVLGVHDEWISEVPDSPAHFAERQAELMCSDLKWNEGLPLAAAGFETDRYHKD